MASHTHTHTGLPSRQFASHFKPSATDLSPKPSALFFFVLSVSLADALWLNAKQSKRRRVQGGVHCEKTETQFLSYDHVDRDVTEQIFHAPCKLHIPNISKNRFKTRIQAGHLSPGKDGEREVVSLLFGVSQTAAPSRARARTR